MSRINFSLQMNINECANTIMAIGHEITPIIISEPGVGKSSILKMLEEKHGDAYDYIYVDCPVKDMMDVAASIPNHQSKALEYYVSSLFKLDSGKPKIIMLDEFMKAPKLLQIIFTRLMLERTVGDKPLDAKDAPIKSIVFGTSNNASDGVGDGMLAHAGNRVCKIQMSKPDADAWCAWATKNNIARPIRAWVTMNPKVMNSYLDPNQEDNEYIFRPSKTEQFASPRSLAKASIIVDKRDVIGENALAVALAGTIGEAAAKSMAAFVALEDRLILTKDILKDAKRVAVPDDVSALVMMMFEAVDYLDNQDDLNDYMEFVSRIKQSEIQSIFFTMMMRTKPRLARYNTAITKWATENHMLM
jgi:MoxR-like ATPase